MEKGPEMMFQGSKERKAQGFQPKSAGPVSKPIKDCGIRPGSQNKKKSPKGKGQDRELP